MKTTKKIAIVFIVLIAIGLLIFATIKLQIPRRIKLWHPSEETIRKDVTEYLEERYNEEFVITNILFPGFNYASYIITAYPEGAPQQVEYKITIHGWEDKGLINYCDNYPIVKLIPELRAYTSDVVGKYFPENTVYVDFYQEWIRGNIDKDLTFDKFINDIEGEWHSAGWFDICIPSEKPMDEEMLNTLNEMAAYMAENKLSGFFFIDVMYKNYESLTESKKDLNDILEKNGKDFVNYNYVISRYGKFDENTEVK